jgi:hypothetical protein
MAAFLNLITFSWSMEGLRKAVSAIKIASG